MRSLGGCQSELVDACLCWRFRSGGWSWLRLVPARRFMACKRSGVRISLAPPGQKLNSNKSNRAVQQQSTATAARWAAVRVFGSVSRHSRGLLARPRIQSLLRCFQACHLGKFSFLGICDTCRLVATRMVRPVSRAVTVPVFAGGLRARPRHPRSTPGTRAGHTGVRFRASRPWALVVAPDGAGKPVYCAA